MSAWWRQAILYLDEARPRLGVGRLPAQHRLHASVLDLWAGEWGGWDRVGAQRQADRAGLTS